MNVKCESTECIHNQDFGCVLDEITIYDYGCEDYDEFDYTATEEYQHVFYKSIDGFRHQFKGKRIVIEGFVFFTTYDDRNGIENIRELTDEKYGLLCYGKSIDVAIKALKDPETTKRFTPVMDLPLFEPF